MLIVLISKCVHRAPISSYVTGGEDWTKVKEEMKAGLQHLTQEMVRFEDMLKQKQLP